MSTYKRQRRSGSSNSDLKEFAYSYYRELRDEKVKLHRTGKYFLCPYCRDNEREYELSDLERHASRLARDSKSATFREKTRHMGLLRYLDWYQRTNGNPLPVCKTTSSIPESKVEDKHKCLESGKGAVGDLVTDSGDVEMAAEPYDTFSQKANVVGGLCGLDIEPGEITVSTEDNAFTNDKHRGRIFKRVIISSSTNEGDDELIVWPWMAIVANIRVTKNNDGKYVGESGRNLREEWVKQGYNPVKVIPLWNYQGHSGFAIVLFQRDWEGFRNAIAFEKEFEMHNHGKNHWRMRRDRGDELYAWVARRDDYWDRGLIGKHLQKNGDLKTLHDIQTEHIRKDTALMCNLNEELKSKMETCEEMQEKISKADVSIKSIIVLKEEMIQRFNIEMEMLRDKESNQLRKIHKEQERSKRELEARREELKLREKDLRQRQSLNDKAKKKLDDEKKMTEDALTEQSKANERMWKLAEEHKNEKDLLHKKILELNAHLDQKQALELQIQQLRGAAGMMKHMGGEDPEDMEKLVAIQNELKEKEEEYEDLESTNQALIIKERNTNDELQDARKEMIKCFKDARSNICVKWMGALDKKAFLEAAKLKYPGKVAATKATELCSLWEEHLRDSSWHPFKIVMVDETPKRLIDEEDEKLKELKTEWGDEVCNAVIKALDEMNEFNPSGNYPVPELWNTSENRKARLIEGVDHLLKQWKLHKPKRRRNC